MTVGRDDVKVSKYEISEISTVHDVIEVKKGYSVIKVMEANSHGFTDIIISQDTVIIKYMPTVVYKFVDNAFGLKVRLDTTISIDKWRQRVAERENHKL